MDKKMIKQGPTTISSESRRVCGLCRFHNQHMLISGKHPLYKHQCEHPASIEHEKDCRVPNFRGYAGREIGHSDTTPEWCPVVAMNLAKISEISHDESGGLMAVDPTLIPNGWDGRPVPPNETPDTIIKIWVIDSGNEETWIRGYQEAVECAERTISNLMDALNATEENPVITVKVELRTVRLMDYLEVVEATE